MNHVLHVAAIVQIRHDTDGRAYYRRKLADGKTPMEALRCLKRRLSDVVYRQLVADARLEDGADPGGHCGATLQSSAADSHPLIDTSDQPLRTRRSDATPTTGRSENPPQSRALTQRGARSGGSPPLQARGRSGSCKTRQSTLAPRTSVIRRSAMAFNAVRRSRRFSNWVAGATLGMALMLGGCSDEEAVDGDTASPESASDPSATGSPTPGMQVIELDLARARDAEVDDRAWLGVGREWVRSWAVLGRTDRRPYDRWAIRHAPRSKLRRLPAYPQFGVWNTWVLGVPLRSSASRPQPPPPGSCPENPGRRGVRGVDIFARDTPTHPVELTSTASDAPAWLRRQDHLSTARVRRRAHETHDATRGLVGEP